MNILAIDVAVRDIQVGLLATDTAQDRQESDFFYAHIETERGQAEQLVPAMADILGRAGLSPKSLNLIAVTRGPGSFTGVRIGLATARSFAMALDIEAVGFSTLELILGAEQQATQSRHHVAAAISEPILALIDTKRGDYYGLSSDMVLNQQNARIFTPEEVEDWRNKISGKIICDALPPLEHMARLAASLKTTDHRHYPPTPIYIREAEIHQKTLS